MAKKVKYSSTIVSSSESDSDDSEIDSSVSSMRSVEAAHLEKMTRAALMDVSDDDSDCEKDTDNGPNHELFFIDKSTKKPNPGSDKGDEPLQSRLEEPHEDTQEPLPQRVLKGKMEKRVSNRKGELSSSIEDSLDHRNLYINTDVYNQCTAQHKNSPHLESQLPSLSKKNVDEILQKSVLPSDLERQHTIPPYEVSLHAQRLRRREERSKTKGKEWFNMSAPEMTDELKNDLTVLKMRHVLDPKRFYKRPDLKVLPKFFQTGKIVADATDFYSSRVPKKQQKKNLVDELLEDAEFKRYSKRKYAEILEKKQQSRKYKGAAKHMKRLKKKNK